MAERVKSVDIDGVTFKISRMGVFTASLNMVWFQNTFKDTITAAMAGAGASGINDAITQISQAKVSDNTGAQIAKVIGSLTGTLTEACFSEVVKRLLFDTQSITFFRQGGPSQLLSKGTLETQEHGEEIVGAIDNPAALIELMTHVIMHNYSDFFPKLLEAIGRLMPKQEQFLQGQAPSQEVAE